MLWEVSFLKFLVFLASLYLCEFILNYSYAEFVSVNGLLTEVSLETNFLHSSCISACKEAQREKGLRDSAYEFRC